MYIAHTTARFCTHATRGEAQDNMHSLFGVALHRARVLGAALVESTEQGPQGAKAPGVHGRAARRFVPPDDSRCQTIRGAGERGVVEQGADEGGALECGAGERGAAVVHQVERASGQAALPTQRARV